jgi:Trk-type K+ transport system membrane component
MSDEEKKKTFSLNSKDTSYGKLDDAPLYIHQPTTTAAAAEEEDKVVTNIPSSFLSSLRSKFRTLNYFQLHLLYFIIMGFFGGILIKMNDPQLSLTDALFTGYSAITVTGLTVYDTSRLSNTSLIIISILVIMGSTFSMSLIPLLVRRFYYRRVFGDHINQVHPFATKQEIRRPSLVLTLTNYEQRALQYHAMGILIRVIIIYALSIQIIAFLLLWMYGTLNESVHNAIGDRSIAGWALFMTLSSFYNAGFVMNSNNLVQFQHDAFVLLLLGLIILLGNTAFPIALRGIVRILKKYAKSESKCTYIYLLAHPRECFTLLFPGLNTQLLLLTVLVVNISEWILFIWLDAATPALQGSSNSEMVLIGLFQSISTRTAGFNVIDLSI